MKWHIFKRSTNSLVYLGTASGTTLEQAVIEGMVNDDQFKAQVRESMPLEKVANVELYGVPTEQMRSTKIKSSRLLEGH